MLTKIKNPKYIFDDDNDVMMMMGMQHGRDDGNVWNKNPADKAYMQTPNALEHIIQRYAFPVLTSHYKIPFPELLL